MRNILIYSCLGLLVAINTLAQTVTIPVELYQKGTVLAEIPSGPKVQITGMALSGNGKILATGGYGEVVLWDLQAPRLQKRIQTKAIAGHVRSVQFISDNLLAVGCGEPGLSGILHIINTSNNKVKISLPLADDIITKIAVSPDKKTIAAGDAMGNVYIVNPETSKSYKLTTMSNEISGLQFRKDTVKLGISSLSGEMVVWDIQKKLPFFTSRHASSLTGFTFVKNGNAAVVAINKKGASEVNLIRVFNTETSVKKVKTNNSNKSFSLPEDNPTSIVAFNKGNFVFIACSNGSLHTLSPYQMQDNIISPSNGKNIIAMCLSKNEKIITLANEEGCMQVWSAKEKRLLVTLLQTENGKDDWFAITPRGFYATSLAEDPAWKDETINAAQLDYLRNPEKVATFINTRYTKKQSAK